MLCFIADVKKLYKNKLFLLAITLLLFVSVVDPIFRHQAVSSKNPFMWWLFMPNGIGSAIFYTLYWIFPMLLTGLAFFDERNSAVYGLLITRVKRSTYFISKGLSLFTVVFLNLILVFLLNLLLIYIVCPSNAPIYEFLIPRIDSFAYPLYQISPVTMAVFYNILNAFVIAAFSVLFFCLHMIMKFKCKYITIIFPSLLMYASVYAVQRIVGAEYTHLILCQPMAAASMPGIDTEHLILVIGSLILITLICFVVGVIRNRDAL